MKKKTFLIAKTLILMIAFLLSANGAWAQKRIISKSIKPKPKAAVKSKSNFTIDDSERQIFELVNLERKKKGLSELEWRPDLALLARVYSQKMAQNDFFGHFESNGDSVVQRAKAMRVKHWSKIGENLFEYEEEGNFDAFAVQKWMESETHRENILDPDWTSAGVGIAKSNDGKIYITQVFVKE